MREMQAQLDDMKQMVSLTQAKRLRQVSRQKEDAGIAPPAIGRMNGNAMR